jgi:hypothetical protein
MARFLIRTYRKRLKFQDGGIAIAITVTVSVTFSRSFMESNASKSFVLL